MYQMLTKDSVAEESCFAYNVLRVNRCYGVYVTLLYITFLDALNDCFRVIVHVEWVE